MELPRTHWLAAQEARAGTSSDAQRIVDTPAIGDDDLLRARREGRLDCAGDPTLFIQGGDDDRHAHSCCFLRDIDSGSLRDAALYSSNIWPRVVAVAPEKLAHF